MPSKITRGKADDRFPPPISNRLDHVPQLVAVGLAGLFALPVAWLVAAEQKTLLAPTVIRADDQRSTAIGLLYSPEVLADLLAHQFPQAGVARLVEAVNQKLLSW